MLKSIFKSIEDPMEPTYFQQKNIDDKEKIPEGWTDNFEEIPMPNWEIDNPKNITINPNARSANITEE
ncbi:MAG: hypothetical protein L0J91_06400 [Lactococcus lactis]|nr:hypothetical protein [Lactococcus lactis]MDN6423311.1 hypothetical protein [Tetragenococcus koreensis]MDN6640658.1 hypothetical protein [Tetragenococcus sp.]